MSIKTNSGCFVSPTVSPTHCDSPSRRRLDSLSDLLVQARRDLNVLDRISARTSDPYHHADALAELVADQALHATKTHLRLYDNDDILPFPPASPSAAVATITTRATHNSSVVAAMKLRANGYVRDHDDDNMAHNPLTGECI